MAKTPAQLDAEIAEALRAKQWQEQVAREDRDRRARIAGTPGPSPEQLYDERAADLAAGVFHGEPRGRAREFRRTPAQKKALQIALAQGHVYAGRNPGERATLVSAGALHALERAGLLTLSRTSAQELVGTLTRAGAAVAGQ